ncbi:MAG TPA: hypothetical protein VJM34_09375 [Novosphingobium sp.]|uniref:hypothetical protein n=1 Tax=Rhizorhapis sp. TaxID=1968842 RepID=UPI002B465E47|nr:hypothetical protein [Rhizorhapis sp.]HKR16887.1 hypothetical protein [Rhizorhapis sp.]HKX78716.1 hypothetical protein [Novosphingobium sp.]
MRFMIRAMLVALVSAAMGGVPAGAQSRLSPAPAVGYDGHGIEILSGVFGRIGKARKQDIVERAQSLCGTGANSCQLFCSETSFGRYSLGRKPICRITWRCPDGNVHAIEAAKEEPMLMRCSGPARIEPAVDELAPLTYTPPGR